jgi:Fe2+ or Zn2+ uptake regulation protein
MLDAATADAALRAALHARGQRVTPQRLLIQRALIELGRHASAEEVHRQVSGALPNASLPTVYATLDLLGRLGLARRVRAGPGAILYDPRPDGHGHLVCETCGAVEDLDYPVDPEPALRKARAGGFAPAAVELVISGRCAGCAAS